MNLTVRSIDDGITVVKPTEKEETEPQETSNSLYDNLVKYPSLEKTISTELEIVTFLMNTFQSIILNDSECIANIIDKSGLVILSAQNLIRLIAMVCDIKDTDVKLEIEEKTEPGCCGVVKHVLPVKTVCKIRVMKDGDIYKDFQLAYNDLYNKIIDQYKISLENIYQKLI